MILIAVGTNLPGRFASPLAAAEAAAREVAALVAGPARLSPWYVTAPVPPSGQPDYINGVIGFPEAAVDPVALLEALQAVEASFGRVRTVANAARVLDLDIAAIGALVRSGPDPVLPHPRLHERRFVLEPLRDVDPGFRHPVLGLDVAAMLARLPPGGIRRAASAAVPEGGGVALRQRRPVDM